MDPRVSIDTGYAESKWVAERLTQLSRETCLRSQVIRAGLLTGGASGSWDTSHWFPALAQSCIYLGCLPEGDDVSNSCAKIAHLCLSQVIQEISWLPIDIAAAAIVDLDDAVDSVVHVVHPRPVCWSTIMEPLADILKVPLVPYKEWLSKLENVAANSSLQDRLSSRYSAVKLLAFFQQGLHRPAGTESMGLMPRVTMENGVRASATLGSSVLPQLGRRNVKLWVEYWREVGFLPSEC